MTQVTETITRPDGTPAAGLKVRFVLAGATRAFASADDETVLPVVEVVTDQDGQYTVDLPPNSELNPAGTRWRRSFGGRDIGIASDEIIVPVSGGPYPVEDILAAPLEPVSPGTPNRFGVIAHDWDRDGWAPFQPVVITAHGSQQFDLEVDAGRGVVTGP